MQKYKIVASKSQKKYTLIISASSEPEARSKIHKQGYSILGISEIDDAEIKGKKFIFQIQTDTGVKNGIIVGKDIFKVYIKLRDELEYDIISLYPEGDDIHSNAEKKQKIITELQRGYELRKSSSSVKEKGNKNESFYLKKELEEVHSLIEKALKKFDSLFNNRKDFPIDEITFQKLEKVYEKLVHIKTSTNLAKLREIGELALVKIAEVELKSVETEKRSESKKLLKETNNLLKKIGSEKQFIEKDKDVKRMIWDFFNHVKQTFSLKELKKSYSAATKSKNLIDTQSYDFLKTVLLLEKYKEKKLQNTHKIIKHIPSLLNPFSQNPSLERLLLKKKVIEQNISILRAKKTWSLGSYTGVKKWYHKILESFFSFLYYIAHYIFATICIFSFLFFVSQLDQNFNIWLIYFNAKNIVWILSFFLLFFLLHISKNILLFSVSIVFFSFVFIFSQVNF